MVAAKPLVAATLLLLCFAAAALADSPTVRIKPADQAEAVSALLRGNDLGAGWSGGKIRPLPLSSPSCPGFDPKESDLVVNGHADAKFTFRRAGVEIDQDVQVLASAAAVREDFARTMSTGLARCLAHQLRRSPHVVSATVARLRPFPPAGTVSAAYRAEIVVHGGGVDGRLVSDFVFFGEGKVEYSLNVIAPARARNQLVRFESALTALLLRRLGAGPA